jgi:guanylate kinase
MEESLRYKLIEKARTYQLPDRAVTLLDQNPPLILVGVTAAGKDTVMNSIEQSSDYRHVITHTTRAPRPGETNGQNYWFVDDVAMLNMLEQEAVIEANAVHGDTVYATSLAAYETVPQNGKKPLLVIDIQGAQDILHRLPDFKPFFLLPPNFEEWMERLNRRGHMTHTERAMRLRSARSEIEKAIANDKFILVVNQDIKSTTTEILRGQTDPMTQRRNREIAQQLIDHIRHY